MESNTLQSLLLMAVSMLLPLGEVAAQMDMGSSGSVSIGGTMMNMAPTSAAYEIPKDLYGKDAYTIADTILNGESPSNVTTYSNCSRECSCRGRPRLCYWEFQIENFHAMGPICGNCSQGVLEDCYIPQCIAADGIEMGVTSINRIIPGPYVEVCNGDIISIRVTNMMFGQETTVHWHGIHQTNTQYMDGVPMVTQCPIPSGATFRYTYWANNSGTHFYHSHSGYQILSGVLGPLTVRDDPVDDPNSDLYDFDIHHLLVCDWIHSPPELFVPGLPTRLPGIGLPQSLLINGHGRVVSEFTGNETMVPYETFFVNNGSRYRFRCVDAGGTVCPYRLQIEQHNLTMISSDGESFKPIVVDSFVFYPGERYDFVLHANKPVGNYWIHVSALGACEELNISQVAVLAYNQNSSTHGLLPSTAKPGSAGYGEGTILNHPNSTCSQNSTRICIHQLVSNEHDNSVTQEDPDVSFFLRAGEPSVNKSLVYSNTMRINFIDISDDNLVLATIDNITTMMASSPMLSQPNAIDQTTLCNISSKPDSCRNTTFCACNHYRKVALNQTVQIIFMDDMGMNPVNHPFHLHGTSFWIMRVGQDTSQMLEALGNNQTAATFLNNTAPPLKDTVSIPSGGYAAIRWRATNPGIWMLHCHFDDHMLAGMSLVIRVGELSDVPSVPKNFPMCGDFK